MDAEWNRRIDRRLRKKRRKARRSALIDALCCVGYGRCRHPVTTTHLTIERRDP